MPEIRTASAGQCTSGSYDCIVVESPERFVIAQVQFGQATRKCRGSGICKVDLYRNMAYANNPVECSRAIGRIGFFDSKLALVFDRHGLCRQLYHKYFTKGHISLWESLLIEPALCQKLNLPPTIIPEGRHRVIQSGSYCLIIFEKTVQEYVSI